MTIALGACSSYTQAHQTNITALPEASAQPQTVVLGTIEVGKLADILVIDNNPLEDLSSLTQVKMVIHGGEIIR